MAATFYFFGVKLGDDRRVGFIQASELVKHFGPSWIPYYQRERVQRREKIIALTDIFKRGAPIDSIKLNLIGTVDQDGKEALLDGDMHVIDGQQRLWALKESGATDYKMPVELYINLPMEKEVELFHQFNDKGTDLSFGDLARSYAGPVADLLRRLIKSKRTPIPMIFNNPKLGLNPSMMAPIMYLSYKKLMQQLTLKGIPSAGRLKQFLQMNEETFSVELLEFAVRNLLQKYVDLFGSFDHRAACYRRSVFLAWNHVVINNFLTPMGKIDFGKHAKKAEQAPSILRNSRAIELFSTGGTATEIELYDLFIEHFNYKLKGGLLLSATECSNDQGHLTRKAQRQQWETEITT